MRFRQEYETELGRVDHDAVAGIPHVAWSGNSGGHNQLDGSFSIAVDNAIADPMSSPL
jgi:hypothetical protein